METSLRLPVNVGRTDWRQLSRRHPRTAHGFGSYEEPNHQAMETPYWHSYTRQLPGHAPKLRL